MTKGDVKHVIEALVEEVQERFGQRKQGEVESVWYVSHDILLSGVATSAECTVKNIKRVNIRFVRIRRLKLVNNSHAATRSPANVTFALENWKIRKADHRMEVIPAATPAVTVAWMKILWDS